MMDRGGLRQRPLWTCQMMVRQMSMEPGSCMISSAAILATRPHTLDPWHVADAHIALAQIAATWLPWETTSSMSTVFTAEIQRSSLYPAVAARYLRSHATFQQGTPAEISAAFVRETLTIERRVMAWWRVLQR